jgi:uncharacterized protein
MNDAVGGTGIRRGGQRRPVDVLGFLAFSHGWTWAFWGLAGLSSASVWEMPGVILFVIGGAGVAVGGVVMSRLVHGPAGLRDLGRRIIDPRPISATWWAVIMLLFPALVLVSAGIAQGMGLTAAPIDLDGAMNRLANPAGLLAMVLFVLVIGPLPEEVGWRGYLLDRVQARWNALAASLLIALIWWSWHLPLFVLPGYFDAFGRAAPAPLDFLYGIVPAAILYTWVYNNTNRSVLAVIVIHFMQNFSSEFLGVATEARPILLVLTWATTIVVLVGWGAATLRRGEPVPLPPGSAPRALDRANWTSTA